MQLTTLLQLLPRSRKRRLSIHFPIRLHSLISESQGLPYLDIFRCAWSTWKCPLSVPEINGRILFVRHFYFRLETADKPTSPMKSLSTSVEHVYCCGRKWTRDGSEQFVRFATKSLRLISVVLTSVLRLQDETRSSEKNYSHTFVSLPSSSHIFWLHYSDFLASCHLKANQQFEGL